MKLLFTRTGLGSFLIGSGCLACLHAATPIPSWSGNPGTTRQGYHFDTAATTPDANILSNPYGIPTATVTTGSVSDGWQDPMATFSTPGVDSDGAWDIGKSGNIAINAMIAASDPAPGLSYRVEFLVYVVAYAPVTALPSFEAIGLNSNDLAYIDELVAPDPPLAEWRGLTWTGSFDNVSTDSITLKIASTDDNLSVIDTYEVFTMTTLVPEPSNSLLLLVAAGFTLGRRRRNP